MSEGHSIMEHKSAPRTELSSEAFAIESLLRIVNKDQQDVDFKLNRAQREIDLTLSGRDLYPKARREGVSRYFLARSLIRCLGIPNTVAVVISHEAKATQRMLDQISYFIDHIKCPKPVIDTHNRNEISFPKTNSVFYIGTAGAKAFGRGDFISDLHCSEIAYWPDAKTLTAGLFQAVPRTGTISIESTGNGAGDFYHSLCMKAARGEGRFKLHFLPWYEFPEYQLPTTPDTDAVVLASLDEDFEERTLVEKYHVTAGQILWRRERLEELDYDLRLLRQEYPTTLLDCFQAMGSGIFYKIFYHETSDWERRDTFLWALRGHPIPGRNYVLGADVSGGVYRDSSVIEVLDCVTGEQVAEWVSNRTAPDTFAAHIATVGGQFNGAFASVESNNHGIVTLAELRHLYPAHLIRRLPSSNRRPDEVARLVDMGSRVTARNKPYLIGKMRKFLAGGAAVHSPILKSELDTFVEFEDGSMGAQEGSFDDCVMAYAHACYMLERAAMIDKDEPQTQARSLDPFTLEGIIADLTKDRATALFSDEVYY